MPTETITVKKSPIEFLKLLVIIEFAVALLPWLATLLLDARTVYEATPMARNLDYNLLNVIVLTTLQVLILVGAFISWYLPTYVADSTRILLKRGGLAADRQLVATQELTDVRVRQGPLARRFNYGSLQLMTAAGDAGVISNVPAPEMVASQLLALTEPDSELTLSDAVALPPVLSASPFEMIANGEDQFVEFKSSLMWDYRQQRANKELYGPVMKNIVGFMNSRGGALLIGVDDDGNVLGLEPDYSVIKKPDRDGFENVFNMAFNSMIGVEFRRFADVTFPVLDDREICLIVVHPADQPAYLTHKGTEQFYIRAGNGSQSLSVSKAARYIRTRFAL